MNNEVAGPGHSDPSIGKERGKEGLLLEGRHEEALVYFADLLRLNPENGEALDGASRALIELVREGSINRTLDTAGRNQLYRTLIMQEVCAVAPPVLHHLIAGRYTSGDSDVIQKMAAELTPVLADLYRNEEISANYVLMLLVLRNAITGWISQEQISQLHIQWFHAFKLSDLSLPYSSMFASHQFRRNRDDLARVVADTGLAARFLDELSLVQMILLEWLLETDLIGGACKGDIRTALSSRLAGRQTEPEEVAAAKSLLVRHGWGPEGPDLAFLVSVGLDPQLDGLVSSVGEAREGIPRPSSARTGLRPWLFHNRAWQGMQAAKHLAAGKGPSILRRGRKPKAAICVSGQLRGYKAAFSTWKQTLLPLLDYDIFVHSWTRIGRSGAEPHRHVLPFEGESFQEKYRETCRKLGFDEFRKHYPLLLKGLSDTGSTTEDEVAAFYGSNHVRLDDEAQPQFAGWSNSEKMHAKIEACFNLVAESGRDYDLIVRIRPDLPIKLVAFDAREMQRICQERPVIFADHAAGLQFANPMIGDQLAIGAPGPMRIYSSTWTIHAELARNGLLQVAPTLQGHTSLAQNCWVHGISVGKAPIRFGKLQDPAPLSRKEIKEFLEEDARDRGDWTDRQLIDAVAADLQAQT